MYSVSYPRHFFASASADFGAYPDPSARASAAAPSTSSMMSVISAGTHETSAAEAGLSISARPSLLLLLLPLSPPPAGSSPSPSPSAAAAAAAVCGAFHGGGGVGASAGASASITPYSACPATCISNPSLSSAELSAPSTTGKCSGPSAAAARASVDLALSLKC